MDCEAPLARERVDEDVQVDFDLRALCGRFREILKTVGLPSEIRDSPDEVEFVLENCLCFVGANHLEYFSFAKRLASFPQNFRDAVSLCADGLYFHEGKELCFCCGFIDDSHAASLTNGHTDYCAFKSLKLRLSRKEQMKDIHRTSSSTTVLKHLRSEVKSTKFTVAVEFGYDSDVICLVLAKQYIQYQSSFSNAGDLIEALIDEESFQSLPFQLERIFEYVDKFRSPSKPTLQLSMHQKLGKEQPNDPLSDSRSLREETLKLYLQMLCKSCLRNTADHLVSPCDHVSLCSRCAMHVQHCPLCASRISSTLKVFIN